MSDGDDDLLRDHGTSEERRGLLGGPGGGGDDPEEDFFLSGPRVGTQATASLAGVQRQGRKENIKSKSSEVVPPIGPGSAVQIHAIDDSIPDVFLQPFFMSQARLTFMKPLQFGHLAFSLHISASWLFQTNEVIVIVLKSFFFCIQTISFALL